MWTSPSRAALVMAAGLLALPALAQDAAPPVAAGGPANLCQELKAFVTAPEAKKQEAATPPGQATAVSNPSGKSDAKPSGSGGEPQQKSGLSGATGSADAVAPGDRKAALAQANASAKAAAAPAASPPPPKPDAATVARIEAAAATNDQASCRAAALVMRKAGVPMPPPLLALAALDLKFQTGQEAPR
ncbi:MAG: hypothetical protein Q7T93_09240 [Methylobacterium sp.]|uniref:hypothetical protein n=1 Tax=Methylobacterium sp. TaxID=409 RepID=UPI002719B537|nr:hypothetical protein [Methylobacterium sp.]MDO9427008.1 hypothetical protein [Methylobacterium sp.]